MASTRATGGGQRLQRTGSLLETAASPRNGSAGGGTLDALHAGAPMSARTVLQMQRLYGNRATSRYTGAIQRQTDRTAAAPTAAKSGNTTIQMKPAMLDSWMGAHLREYTEDNSSGTPVYTVDGKKKKGPKIKHKQKFEDKEISDSTGKWQMIELESGESGFIDKDKVSIQREDQEDIIDSLAGNIESGSELITSGTDGASDTLEEIVDQLGEDNTSAEKDRAERAGGGTTATSGAINLFGGGLAGMMAMRKAVVAFKDTEKSKSEKAWEMTEAGIEGVEGISTSVSGGADLVDGAAKATGKSDGIGASDAVSGWSGSVTEAIGVIKSSFFTVKAIYEMFEKATSDQGISAGEVFEDSLSIISNGLQAAQSAVKTVFEILKILKLGTGGLSAAIPGLGIAISGIEITIKVYDIIKAQVASYRMKKVKQDFKTKYDGSNYMKDNTYSIGGRTLWSSKGTDKEKLGARRELLEKKTSRTPDEETELADIKRYELAKEMKYINSKRTTRAGIKVFLEMMNIAGDIATLTGKGAVAGIPLKAVAAGAGVSMGIARKVKQFGRDRAAKDGSWDITKRVFNADKSSQKKYEKRVRDTDVIMDMVAALPPVLDDSTKDQYKAIEAFIEAAGCSTRALYRLNGKVNEQRKLLMESMKKRE